MRPSDRGWTVGAPRAGRLRTADAGWLGTGRRRGAAARVLARLQLSAAPPVRPTAGGCGVVTEVVTGLFAREPVGRIGATPAAGHGHTSPAEFVTG